MKILAVDIGNSDIVWGIYKEQSWLTPWRHPSNDYLSAEGAFTRKQEETGIDLQNVEKVIFSSVVPGISPYVLDIVRKMTGKDPVVMNPELYQSLNLKIDNPWEIGSDLVANAVAGYTKFRDTCIIVDFGTALTFTVVDSSAYVKGVAIAPGLKTAMNSLFFNTAQLPQVPLEMPPSPIGKTTAHALQSGIMIGYIGLINEVLDRMEAELGRKPKIIATGGLSSQMKQLHTRFDVVDAMLTLEGLRLIAIGEA